MLTVTLILAALAISNAPINDSTMKDNVKLKTTKTEKAVVKSYKAIENGVVNGYKAIENGVVNGYKKIEGKFVETFLETDSAGSKPKLKTTKTEKAVVKGYKAVEKAVVDGYKYTEEEFKTTVLDRAEKKE